MLKQKIAGIFPALCPAFDLYIGGLPHNHLKGGHNTMNRTYLQDKAYYADLGHTIRLQEYEIISTNGLGEI